jgi:hypothetical protein
MDLRRLFDRLNGHLGERQRRLLAAVVSLELGHGGITAVSAASGLSRPTIYAGIDELSSIPSVDPAKPRQRRAGGGRKAAEELDTALVTELEKLIEPYTQGDPETPLSWTRKGLRVLSAEL